MLITAFRWWHIAEVMPIEDELFGVERWSDAMFWSELANGHYYRVALADPTVTSGPDERSATGDAEVIGYAGMAMNGPDEAWVQTIGVCRRWQGRGVGRALLEDLLAEARRRGAYQMLLEVAVDNQRAQRLYARYGFEPIGIRRGYYQPSNTDALVMKKEPL